MKYYIIYKKGHFEGYTTDKNLLDNFLNNRKGNYKIIKYDESEIPDKIKKSNYFPVCELDKYINYYTDNNTVLFNYESFDMEDHILEDAMAIHQLLRTILNNLMYIKLTNEEIKIIKASFNIILDYISAITESNEIIFDEIFDIHKYFYERYLPNRKKARDINTNSFS